MDLFPTSALSQFAGVIIAFVLVLAFLMRTPKGKGLPPFVVSRIPLIGHFIAFTKPIDMIRENYKRYGPVFSMNMMGQCLTFLIGPEAQEAFFRASDDDLSQAKVYGFMTPVFGKGVVYDTTKERRTQQMKLLAGSLGTSNMRAYVPMIVAEAEAFFDKWGQSGTVDLKKALPELIILTASRCLMGKEVRQTLFQQVAELYHDLDKGIKPISFFFPNLPIPDHFARDRARKEMVRLFSRVIRKRRKAIANGTDEACGVAEGEGRDVLADLIAFKYRSGEALTDNEIVGLLIALLFAGQHTSSLTSAWAVMLMVSNPTCLHRMLSEQQELLGGQGQGRSLDYDSLKDMTYLHRCVKETLRLHPPLIMLMRKVLKPSGLKVGGFNVPEGHIVVSAPKYANYLDKDQEGKTIFQNPDDFDPDRFKPESEGGRAEDARKFAFISFGGGMHACMGQQFAYLQLKAIMSVLFRRYKLELVNPVLPESDYEAMVVGPKGPCLVRYERIKED